MGKTTLYHPVSLLVIRGAAEYCGFKFGKIKQVRAFPDIQRASYNAEIVNFPEGWDKKPFDAMQKALQNCFMDDIQANWLRRTRSGRIMCYLSVGVPAEVESQ